MHVHDHRKQFTYRLYPRKIIATNGNWGGALVILAKTRQKVVLTRTFICAFSTTKSSLAISLIKRLSRELRLILLNVRRKRLMGRNGEFLVKMFNSENSVEAKEPV